MGLKKIIYTIKASNGLATLQVETKQVLTGEQMRFLKTKWDEECRFKEPLIKKMLQEELDKNPLIKFWLELESFIERSLIS